MMSYFDKKIYSKIAKKLYSKITLAILCAFFSTTTIFATNYYVDGVNGNNANSGLSTSLAKRTIQAAANLTNPSDVVYIMNGTYTYTVYNDLYILNITRSGTAGNEITYRAYPGHTPKLQHSMTPTLQVWGAILIDASYIVIDGLEIEGNNAAITYAQAYQAWQDYENGIRDWVYLSKCNSGGVSFGKNVDVHHITVRNCVIHDAGSGVGGGRCDYVTIENNLIYNNCWDSMYAGSGISILNPKSIDNVTTYKIYIRNNITHNNKTLVPWEKINALSDGNGIILDVNTGEGNIPAYVGRYLVENNVSYNNGGGGVHAYRANHIDIINNTAYNNGTVVGYPEMDANNCSDVKFYNNVMYARTGGNCNGNDAGGTYDYNLYYNGSSFKNGDHDLTGNPQFVTLATDATANFRLQNTSLAINNGSSVAGQFSAKDILGVSRPVGFSPDMGAYEYATIIPRAEINIKQNTTDIIDGTGTYDFGNVSSTSPQTVTFTIQNIGDFGLNLTGTPRVVVTGTGYSLQTDAPTTVSANGSVTFQVRLTPTILGTYSGTVSIANSDASENPYTFALTGYGYDGTKALQTITFPALPIKVIGDANFSPSATTTATGLTVAYASSNTAVATIVNGNIHIVGVGGTATITASQAGNNATNAAQDVTQILTVTPVQPTAGTNLVSNPAFDVNTSGWTFSYQNSGAASISATGGCGRVTISSLGSTTGAYNIQLSTTLFIIRDRNYVISFKGSADAARNISIYCLMNNSPYTTLFTQNNIPLTTTPTNFGTYSFISSFTGYISLRFLLGGTTTTPVCIDDVRFAEDVILSLDDKKEKEKEKEKKIEKNTAPKVYPNPASDAINIDMEGKMGQQVVVKLYDLHGHILLSEKTKIIYEGKTTLQLKVNGLENGLYFINVGDNRGFSTTNKVVIQK
jgi:hypothetical protein